MIISMYKIRYPPKIRGSQNHLAPSFSVKSKSFRATLSEEKEYISVFFFLNTKPVLGSLMYAAFS